VGTGGFESHGRRPASLYLEDLQEIRESNFWKAHQITFDQLATITEVDGAEGIETSDSSNHGNGNSGETSRNADFEDPS